MADFFAASTIIVSRAGANSVYEMLFLHKLHLLIPLSTLQSRGDQMDNARYFQQQGASVMLAEENLTPATLVRALQEIEENRDILLQKMQAIALPSGNRIVEILKTLSLSTHE
jgi:UDP-N-acetylglucosamine--N-acetylmuramyl-(pentapeptide) pyrophosphoryl-undecaprenol N-acetylglucosamine transferase